MKCERCGVDVGEPGDSNGVDFDLGDGTDGPRWQGRACHPCATILFHMLIGHQPDA